MLIGVNWSTPQTLPIIRQLLDENVADFCEIAIDNFIHLPPGKVREVLQDTPVCFHILSSRFLEKPLSELQQIAKILRAWISEFHPLYVSEHLLQFTENDNYLPLFSELNYADCESEIIKRCHDWQALIGQPILFENTASLLSLGEHQPAFYQRLMQETQAGLLFDISNAYIAEWNGICPIEKWQALYQTCRHFHVGGFRVTKTGIAIDTHDAPIADDVHAWIKKILYSKSRRPAACPRDPETCGTALLDPVDKPRDDGLSDKTLVVELDHHIDFSLWRSEILKIKSSTAKIKAQSFTPKIIDKKIIDELAQQDLYHFLLAIAPSLKTVTQDMFSLWMQQEKTFNWQWPIKFLDWLVLQSFPLTKKMKKELLVAAAIRWMGQGMEHMFADTQLVTSPHFPGVGIQVEKSKNPEKSGRIVVMRMG